MLTKEQLQAFVNCEGKDCGDCEGCAMQGACCKDTIADIAVEAAKTALAYRKMLERLEWSGWDRLDSVSACPVCGWSTEHGHSDDCELTKLLEVRKMFERLTKELWGGCPIEEFSHFVELDGAEAKIIGEGCAHPVVVGKSIDRLAAYEDSGLSPEEIQEMAKKKADGRFVELPCKAGDTIYGTLGAELRRDNKIDEFRFKSACVLLDCEESKIFNLGLWRTYYFRTREEAEKALREGE